MIDCHLTAFFQVHETPPVQETGREFAPRSGDIQAVVRFITITINSSPSPPSITSIIIIQAIVRFITINSSLSSPYCSSTPHILTNKKLPGLPKLQTTFKL